MPPKTRASAISEVAAVKLENDRVPGRTSDVTVNAVFSPNAAARINAAAPLAVEQERRLIPQRDEGMRRFLRTTGAIPIGCRKNFLALRGPSSLQTKVLHLGATHFEVGGGFGIR